MYISPGSNPCGWGLTIGTTPGPGIDVAALMRVAAGYAAAQQAYDSITTAQAIPGTNNSFAVTPAAVDTSTDDPQGNQQVLSVLPVQVTDTCNGFVSKSDAVAATPQAPDPSHWKLALAGVMALVALSA